MASLCGQAHCHSHGRSSTCAPPHIDGLVSCSTRSSKQLQRCSASVVWSPTKQIALPLLRTSTSSIVGTSSYLLLRPPHLSRAIRRSQPGMVVGVIKAAFIFEWIGNIFRFITKTPIKFFAEKLEADLDRAAKMIKTGASIVAKVAKETDEFAEQVERAAEQAEEIAEQVAQATETIEEHIDEILDVVEGEKKVVVTSFKVVDNEDKVAVKSTTIAQDGNKSTVTVETSIVSDSNLNKTNNP